MMFYIKRTWDPVLKAKKKVLDEDLGSNGKLEKILNLQKIFGLVKMEGFNTISILLSTQS